MPIKKLSKHTVLKEGTILDPFNKETYKADLWIKDGYIEDIGKFDVPKSAEIIDCKDKIITHGFSDLHVHFLQNVPHTIYLYTFYPPTFTNQ